MDIVFVSAEIAPFSRWTSAADSVAALPKALRGLGHRVTVISPLWGSIDPAARHLARRLIKVELEIAGEKQTLTLFEGRSTGGVDLAFFGNESLFPRNASAEDAGPESAARWAAFTRATVELLAQQDGLPDLIHVSGWQSAAIPALLSQTTLATVPTVLTIHDARALGLYDRPWMSEFGLDARWWSIEGAEYYGQFSALKAGIQAATRITTPSLTYTKELIDRMGGLGEAIKARGKAVVGVPDGIDISIWNSATDPALESRFDGIDVAGAGKYGKLRCKGALQKELALPVRDDVPLIGAIGSITPESIYGTLSELGSSLTRNELQLVVIAEPGSDPALVQRFVQLSNRWTDRVVVRADADSTLIHRALSACDLAVVSSEDPGGAEAMRAQRYAALPIAHRSGGSADAIVDCDPQFKSGTGFSFDEHDTASLLGALQRALSAFAHREAFRAMQYRAIMIDHSWDRSARLYERLYRAAQTKPSVDPLSPPAV